MNYYNTTALTNKLKQYQSHTREEASQELRGLWVIFSFATKASSTLWFQYLERLCRNLHPVGKSRKEHGVYITHF